MGALFDYHTHSTFCDGRGSLADYARAAARLRFAQIGFSGHAPLALPSDWHMKEAALPAYLEEARGLARELSSEVEVLVGLEVDYVPGISSPRAARTVEGGLDYVIGAVHFLGRFEDGTPWTVDGPAPELARGVQESFGGDARRAVTAYYRLVAEMAETERPDIVAHFDLIKKNNRGLYDEEAPWHAAAAEEALRAIARAGCVVEVNTGAVSRGYREDFYPAAWIVGAMARLGIPVTLGSDAHRPQHVGAHFDRALALLASCGYRECWRRNAGGWQAVAVTALQGGSR